MKFRLNLRFILLVCTILGLLLFIDTFYRNIGRSLFYKAIWLGSTHSKNLIRLASIFLLTSSDEKPLCCNSIDSQHIMNNSEIFLLALADYSFRNHNYSCANYYMDSYVKTSHFFTRNDSLLIPPDLRINCDGSISIKWDTSAWSFCAGSDIATTEISPKENIIRISYQNIIDNRDVVIFCWHGNLPLKYWHTLNLTVNVHNGSFLTFETVSSEGVVRHLNYYRGAGEWDDYNIHLQSGELTSIYLSLSEEFDMPLIKKFVVDSMELRLIP